jgi:putative ABC transport system substrate-binding protein
MRRREFITVLGGAVAAWPFSARAQQPAMPVIGFLNPRGPGDDPQLVHAFRQGLRELGYEEGRNLTVEYRWAGGRFDRLPALAGELVERRVSVIAATRGIGSALAAKAATSTIPIVFVIGSDPVSVGLVASLNRPGGNATGIASLNVEIGPKCVELLHEVVHTATDIALVVNPTNPNAETLARDAEAAGRTRGLQLHVLRASTERNFDTVFAALAQRRAGGLVIGADAFFSNRSEQLAALAFRHMVPTISPYREFAEAGGLMSYGGRLADQFRLVGVYCGRILKGEKPADLPVQQSTKVGLIINLKTAKTLGLTVPPTLFALADEVIE